MHDSFLLMKDTLKFHISDAIIFSIQR